MIKFGPKLESQQMLLSRFVEIGAELFAMSASVSYAQHRIKQGDDRAKTVELADLFCRSAKRRIKHLFRDIKENNDKRRYKLAQRVLDGEYEYLEREIVGNM